MQKRPSVCSPVFNRPRYSTSIYQADVSHRATTRSIPGNPALTRHSLHRLPTCCITSPPFTPRARRAQIPIARAALPTCPFPRFPPLEVFGRRPQLFAAPTMVGRHPKTFTKGELCIAANTRLFDHVMNVRGLQSNHLNGSASLGKDRARRRRLRPGDALRAWATSSCTNGQRRAVLVASDLRKMEHTPLREMAKRGVTDAAFHRSGLSNAANRLRQGCSD